MSEEKVPEEKFNPYGEDMFGHKIVREGLGPIAKKFLWPPFTILDVKNGLWQERKKAWKSFGLKSEVGRDNNLLGMSRTMLEPDPELRAMMDGEEIEGGTSIFDPVLCELIYTWFCPEGGQIIDPFAGGSVRGIVAGFLKRNYWGCDLRAEQIQANREQAIEIKPFIAPQWVDGDSRFKMSNAPDADLIFSCPPYGDLEVYSDDPADLSQMEWKDFLIAYEDIIKLSCMRLKDDSFACFVVGDFRHKKNKGVYQNFVSETIRCFLAAGLELYNEAILATPVGTAAMRVAGQFTNSRKMAKTHQNVLVFVKGDPKLAAEKCRIPGEVIVVKEVQENIESEPVET